MWSSILTRIGLALSVVGALVLALLKWGHSRQESGASEARITDRKRDLEHALEIEKRIDVDLADRVRRYDDAGFRD